MSCREEVLEEILALLVLLAGLADRAAGRSLAIALPMLAGLAHAESVARNYLIGLPAGAPALISTSRSGDRAERLAADFRMLARILRAYLAQARCRARFAIRDIAEEVGSAPAPRRLVRQGRPVPAPVAPDTS
ncbi:hypothetical protein [Aquibium sp. ELW1220]|jgi:hypothetical protein|uniref:hypothetical protein n=1 Tax=Aquibium sp. ELW1220 TaxID=2976766 RepID=UPI0025B0C23E|nr:hypothetical protein [Aquibium sp. ELW1220]MDN2581463.1 hypothetical protein [Aquibium sp. ELW1220]